MTDERIPTERELFGRALELPENEQNPFLVRECSGNESLQLRLEALLVRHKAIGDFLEKPALDALADETHEAIATDSDLPPGTRLGEFEITSRLAIGGTSVVYHARQTSLGDRPVALKVYTLARHHRGTARRFEREARLAARVHHPHLVEVYGFGSEPKLGLAYYAMRVVTGPTLQELLDAFCAGGDPANVSRTRALVERITEIASALSALHESGLIHRDVKPANIVLEGPTHGDDRPPWHRSAVLVDYGLLRPIERDAERRSTIMATPMYAPPEQLLGRDVSASGDVYSLGLCLYDLLSAQSPRKRGSDPPTWQHPMLRDDHDLKAILQRTLAINPRQRYSNGAELAADLRHWSKSEPVEARGAVRRQVRKWMPLLLVAFVSISWGLWLLGANREATTATLAWNTGDLVTLSRRLPNVPPVLRSVLLPDVLANLDPAIGSVLNETADAGTGQGLLAAARLLQAEGTATHPRLVLFLAHRVRVDPYGDRPFSALELAARLLIERPARTPADLSACRPLTEALLERLEGNLADSSAGLILTALSGCARIEDLPSVSACVERIVGGEIVFDDLPRLALRACISIVTMAIETGQQSAFKAFDHAAWLERLAAAFRTIAQDDPSRGAKLNGVFGHLVFAHSCVCRALAFAPISVSASPDLSGWQDCVRAAQLDSELRDKLYDRGPVIRNSEYLHVRYQSFQRFGVLVGLYNDPLMAEVLGLRVPAAGATAGLHEGRCLELYSLGCVEAALQLEGTSFDPPPDADTCLSAFSEQEAMSPIIHKVQSEPIGETLPVGIVASVNFVRSPILGRGDRIAVRTRCATVDPDTWIPGEFYLRLGVAGASELEFAFYCPARPTSLLRLELHLQKGLRHRLPFSGRAVIDIELDGHGVGHRLEVHGMVDTTLAITLGPAVRSRQHHIVIRLNRSSNTTLRIYNVKVSQS